MYDVLRDNIGLLQPINEFNLPWNKKPTRWQRFKNFVGRNKGKIAAGAGMLGAGALGGFVGERKGRYNFMRDAAGKEEQEHLKGFNPINSYKYGDDIEISAGKSFEKMKKDMYKD